MKKNTSLLLTVLLAVLLFVTGCGGNKTNSGSSQSEPTTGDQNWDLVVITDANSVDDRGFNQYSWEGVKQYAEEHNITYGYYKPSEQSTTAYLTAIESAAKNGAKVIVTPGFLFSEAIYEAQDTYPDIKFVFIDGTPANSNGDSKIGDNTFCITFAEEQSGFLAGYAAVKEGYTSLGFFGAMPVPAVVRYGYGFIDGAEYAANEMGLADGSVNLKYTYTGSFEITPEFQSKAAAWYQSGTQVIFGCGSPDNVFAACESVGGDCMAIGVDSDMSASSETCLTSAMKMLQPAVYDAISQYYNNTFPGGTSEIYTIEKDAVGLPMETSRFKNFTQADYDKIVAEMKENKDGITTSIRKDTDSSGKEVTLDDVKATLKKVNVEVVE